MKTKTIQLNPFCTRLVVIVSKDLAKIDRWLKKTAKYDLADDQKDLFKVNDFHAMILTASAHNEPEDIIMIVQDIKNVSAIVHEAVHVTWELQRLCGDIFNYETQETQAYLVDYIVGKVMGIKS